jgi:hypothetical protein
MGLDDDGVNPASGPWMRSLELDLRAAVDPYATAVAVIALHQDPPLGGGHDGEEPGAEGEEPGWEVAAEEVYVDFVALPYGLSARAGLSLLPLGMANRQHPHDLPWTQAPLAHRELLGAESLSDVGLTVSWQPRLRGPIALTATAAALSGGDFETGTLTPGWLGRGEAFTEVGAFDLSLGATGVGRGADAVLGGDLMVRWKGSSWRSFLLLAEALATTDGGAGGYAAVQLQPTRLVYVGARVDRLPGEWGAEGVLSWYASEFLRLRLSLAREEAAWLAQSQLTFVWGSHPVEPYWVNR